MTPNTDSRHRHEAKIYRGTAGLPSTGASKSKITRLLTDWDFMVRATRYALHLPVPLDTEDRRVLEKIIFSHFLSLPQVGKVLFVGCDWYTKHYQKAFFRAHDFWTIDVSASARKFGGTQHLVAPLGQLDQYFPPGHFDLIICNGVYGFGLDAREDCEWAFHLCHSSLRNGGYFILGWDDIPARTPVALDSIESLQRFQKLSVPPFNSWRYVTDTPYRHTYDFYRRAA
jgi:hypothetical protein